METVVYFDCFAGISGDMLLGALVDLGADPEFIQQGLARLGLSGFSLTFSEVKKAGLRATAAQVLVHAGGGLSHPTLATIEQLIRSAGLPAAAENLAVTVFRRLAEAEAAVHGVPQEAVHFHEVGAVDSIVDIVGTALALTALGIRTAYFSPLPTGRGFVQASHGLLPVPAPATLQLLKDAPLYSLDVEGELVTPTGAAFVATLARSFGSMPPLVVRRVGYGAGSRDFPFPNLLRIILGEPLSPGGGVPSFSVGGGMGIFPGLEADQVFLVETNIDDMNPEFYEEIIGRLLAAGALDVFLTPIQMKKSRPATLLSFLAPLDKLDSLAELIFVETTSLGLRYHPVWRRKLRREFRQVETEFGKVTVKVGCLGDRLLNVAPEYEECKKVAASAGVPLKEVYSAALAAARRVLGPSVRNPVW